MSTRASHVGTNMAQGVLNSSSQENAHLTKQKRSGPRGEIELIGLTWVCLQLKCCCDSQSSYSRSFPSRPRFPVNQSVLRKHNTYNVTNCSTEVGEHHILFFPFYVEESSKRAAKTLEHLTLPKECWRLHRWCVCEHKHMSDACPSVGCPKSYRPSFSSTNHFVSSTPP